MIETGLLCLAAFIAGFLFHGLVFRQGLKRAIADLQVLRRVVLLEQERERERERER